MKSKNEGILSSVFVKSKIGKVFGFKFTFWIPKLITFLDSKSKNDRVLRFDFKNTEVFRFQILLNKKTIVFRVKRFWIIQKRILCFWFSRFWHVFISAWGLNFNRLTC